MRFIIPIAILAVSASAFGASLAPADAAQNQDREALRALIRQHANLDAPQPDGTTALQWAAHWNDLEGVKMLLAAGANPKLANRYGVTPLSEAAAVGNAGIIEALLQGGADAKALTTADGETVLMTAARSGNPDAVRILLDHGADMNAKESYRGQTALMWAAAERHAGVVKLLLERGADWKIQSLARDNSMPKLSAASSVTPMARGGLTALHFAAREGDVETGRVMLDGGVDVNLVDADHTSALVVSVLNKHYTFAKFLLDRGADPNIADVRGRAALYAALDMRNEDYSALPSRKEDDALPSLDLVQALLGRGANANAQLTKNLPGRSGMDSGDVTLDAGATPLMRAARAGDHAAMSLLLEHGADPKLTTKDGNTAFLFAAGVGYRDKNTRGSESDALEGLKLLTTPGLDLNQQNPRGETALHGAAGRGADSIVQYLVSKGAALDAKTKLGFTPLDYAMGKNVVAQLPVPHDSTVVLIKKHGGTEGKITK
ncbi:MAG: ankyrin repeat domain-containing protein [Acidobacteriia bacterium]|nr:ankyrin repeat domain-containing protein [Terriglobia bacterium]